MIDRERSIKEQLCIIETMVEALDSQLTVKIYKSQIIGNLIRRLNGHCNYLYVVSDEKYASKGIEEEVRNECHTLKEISYEMLLNFYHKKDSDIISGIYACNKCVSVLNDMIEGDDIDGLLS